jgi:SAM-dependent methyltransferase
VPLVQADAQALPLAGASFDLACSAFGAVPFVPDPGAVHREVHRVVRPGGRWVFSVTHPVRWCFPDDPGPDGLAATTSYFDRRAYVERDGEGRPVYVEHHHTVGDHVRALVAAGFDLLDVVEPEWPAGGRCAARSCRAPPSSSRAAAEPGSTAAQRAPARRQEPSARSGARVS